MPESWKVGFSGHNHTKNGCLLSNHEVLCLHHAGVAFWHLDAPVMRVTGADVPMPYAENLELDATPQKENIINVVNKLLKPQ